MLGASMTISVGIIFQGLCSDFDEFERDGESEDESLTVKPGCEGGFPGWKCREGPRAVLCWEMKMCEWSDSEGTCKATRTVDDHSAPEWCAAIKLGG